MDNEQSLGELAKLAVIGTLIVAGMFCPLGTYAGYQYGSKNVRVVDNSFDDGAKAMCLYFAASADEYTTAQKDAVCEELVNEVRP
jgi:hypothetical protein